MNYYNYLAKLNLKKYKKSYLSLFTVILLSCTFTLALAIFNDSLRKTEEQQRKDIYGSWHICVYKTDDTLYRDMVRHGTIQTVGKMSEYGEVLGTDNSAVGIIGSANEEMQQMGISLMDGSFPKKDNEIAVEMSYLSMLGISYELGQQIPLKVKLYDSKSHGYLQVEKTYTLSGVLRNYSSIWKTDGNSLVSFFVTDTSLGVSPVTENVYASLKKEYVKNADELGMLTVNRGKFVKNDYTYYQFISKQHDRYESFLSGSLLILIVTLTSAFFIFNIFYISLREHNKSFVIMRSLGASNYEITGLYCKELTFILTLSFAAGILFGFLASYGGYLIIKHFIVKTFVFYFEPVKLIFLLGIMIFSVVLFAAFSVYHIRKIPLTGSIALQPGDKITKKHKDKFKPLTIRHMVKIFNHAHKKEAVVYFMLTIGSFLVLVSTFFNSYQKFYEYSAVTNTYPEDYDYGFMATFFEPKSHIGEAEVEKIRKIYGIDYVRAYRCTKYLPVIWSGMENSGYADSLKKGFFKKYAGQAEVYASVYGLSEDERDYKFYMDEVDQGKISKDEFRKGNEVLLYVPVYYKTEDGRMLNSLNVVNHYIRRPYQVIREDTIKPGDKLVLQGVKGEVPVKVGGIIYDFKKNNSQAFIGKPYSIICTDSLYNKLVDGKKGKTYEYLQIFTNKNANYERTDVEISKIKENFYFQNYRLQKEDAKYSAMVSSVISLVLYLISLIITVTVLYNNQAAKMESDYRRNYILRVLGMDKWKINLIYLYNILKNNLLAALTGFIAIFLYQTFLFIKVFYSIPDDGKVIRADRYVIRQYLHSLPWAYIGIFTLVYLTINLLIAIFPVKKYRKLKE
jgi:ABC-type antimicrobial peptide transport system permease subunit